MIETCNTYLTHITIPIAKFEGLVRDSERLAAIKAIMTKYPASSISEIKLILGIGEAE